MELDKLILNLYRSDKGKNSEDILKKEIECGALHYQISSYSNYKALVMNTVVL